jgi:chorismate mutase
VSAQDGTQDGTPQGRPPAAPATPAADGANGLAPFRRRLDFLDGEIARLLGERFDVCREVAHHKRERDIPMLQPERVIEVRERYLKRGAEVNLPPEFTAALFELLIGATCKLEDELIAAPIAAGDGSVKK